jgi:hypothetical protein
MFSFLITFIIFYTITCLQYFFSLNFQKKLLEVMYQNASSKNRIEIKSIKMIVERKSQLYVILLWPIFETYFFIKKRK